MFLRVAAKGGAVDDFPVTGGILLIVLVRSVVISRAHAIIVMRRARSLLVRSLPELHTMKKVSRPNTWEPTCHRPGQPVRSSHCCRRAWRVLHRMRYQVRARRITLFAACHRFPCPIGDRTASKHRLSWRWLYDKKRIRFWLLIWQLELSAHDD